LSNPLDNFPELLIFQAVVIPQLVELEVDLISECDILLLRLGQESGGCAEVDDNAPNQNGSVN
jgi:hypothetical protein